MEEEAESQAMPFDTSRYLAILFSVNKTSVFVCKCVICSVIQDPIEILRMH